MIEFFWKGFALGFAIAAPVGPIGILCIRKTLQFGKSSGLASGLGAAIADTLFATIAAFGLTFLSEEILSWGQWLKLFGSIFLLYLSYRSFISKPPDPSFRLHKMGLVKDFIGTSLLTLTNPLTVICYMAVFAAIGLTIVHWFAGLLLVGGVFLGSFSWWLFLVECVGLLRHKLNHQTMIWINRIAGIAIGLFAIWSLFTVRFTGFLPF